VSSAGRFATGSRQEQRGSHTPPFLHQHVERSARCADIHYFQSNAPLSERRADVRRRKLLRRARAEQHQLRLKGEDRVEIRFRQGFDGAWRPARIERIGGHDAAVADDLLADADFAVRVGAKKIYPRIGVESQLHRITIPAHDC